MSRFIEQLTRIFGYIEQLQKIEPGCAEAKSIQEVYDSYLLTPIGEVLIKASELSSELEMKVQKIYRDFLLRRTGLKIGELVGQAQKRVHKFGVQGGYGHHVSGSYIHHLVIPVDKYELCKFSPEEKFALAMHGVGLRIEETPDHEHWGN